MKNQKLNFEDFEIEKLSKNQQKQVLGGDDTDPGNGKGNGAT